MMSTLFCMGTMLVAYSYQVEKRTGCIWVGCDGYQGNSAALGSIAGQKGDYYGDHWVLLGAIGQIGRVVIFSWITVNS